MREVRAILQTVSPLVVDLIRHVVTPHLARSGVKLTIVTAGGPPPDLIIATEAAAIPAGQRAIVLSSDLTTILGDGGPTTLTPASLADKVLEMI